MSGSKFSNFHYLVTTLYTKKGLKRGVTSFSPPAQASVTFEKGCGDSGKYVYGLAPVYLAVDSQQARTGTYDAFQRTFTG